MASLLVSLVCASRILKISKSRERLCAFTHSLAPHWLNRPQDDKDFMFEDQVLKDPFQPKSWWHYLEHKKDAAPEVRTQHTAPGAIRDRSQFCTLFPSCSVPFSHIKRRIQPSYSNSIPLPWSRPPPAPLQVRFTIFERAVKALPGSYKLWYAYLRERTQLVRGARIDSGTFIGGGVAGVGGVGGFRWEAIMTPGITNNSNRHAQ